MVDTGNLRLGTRFAAAKSRKKTKEPEMRRHLGLLANSFRVGGGVAERFF